MNLKFENLEKIDLILEKLDSLEEKISTNKRWFNVSETANYLGYSKEHIHKLKNDYFIEGIHYHKKVGRILFDRLKLDKWVTTNTKKCDVKDIVNNVLDGIL